MTSIDHFAIATEILGKQCIELSRPPHDVRFGNPHGLVSVDCTTGRWRTTAQIRVGGKTVEMSGGYLKELSEIKKKNGGGDCRTILEEAARQAIAEAEAQEAADEEYEAALAANRSDTAPDTPRCIVATEEHANPSPSLLRYRAEIAAGVDPVEAIHRWIDRDLEDDLKRQEAEKLARDFINSTPGVYELTRDGRLIKIQDSKTAAVQADLLGSSQLQRKLLQIPPDEPKTAAQADPLSTGHQEAAALPPAPDGLRTPAEAARKLGCSVKTLRAHVAAGDLRYVIIGKGTKRPRRMFADPDLNEFIANQTRKDVPCPSTRIETAARRSSISISKSKVIGFMEARNRRRDAKPKR